MILGFIVNAVLMSASTSNGFGLSTFDFSLMLMREFRDVISKDEMTSFFVSASKPQGWLSLNLFYRSSEVWSALILPSLIYLALSDILVSLFIDKMERGFFSL